VYRDLELIPWGGALSEVAGGAAGHPRARFLVKHSVRTGCRAGNETRASATEWVNGSWSITNAVGSGGSYPNYADAALEDWPEAYYGANLSRLQLIKRKYDPGKVFRFDQGLSATW
jgi:berberine-like enzyme